MPLLLHQRKPCLPGVAALRLGYCMTPSCNLCHLQRRIPSSLLGWVHPLARIRHAGRPLSEGSGPPVFAGLLVTASIASVLERRTTFGATVGAPLLCFTAFCFLSNMQLAPLSHPVYDLCWSFLLPLSLSIIIMSNSKALELEATKLMASEECASSSQNLEGPMLKVGLPFLIGAMGSVIGAAIAFCITTTTLRGSPSLPRATAAQIAGAVAATYIGGSVNLFSVAAAVGLMDTTGPSLMGALAASDIFLMALYFSGLMAAHKMPMLHRTFPGASAFDEKGDIMLQEAVEEHLSSSDSVDGWSKERNNGWKSLQRDGRIATLALCFGGIICKAGSLLAAVSPLPGTSTLAVTLLTVSFSHILRWINPRIQGRLACVAPPVASVLLNIFFGSVGASGRWQQVVGVAPAIFTFASVALGIHVVVIFIGSAALNRLCQTNVSIDDIIVASNANIGGPSTAATFAGLIGQDALVVPAALWGTIGYAIATSLGVGVWAFLR